MQLKNSEKRILASNTKPSTWKSIFGIVCSVRKATPPRNGIIHIWRMQCAYSHFANNACYLIARRGVLILACLFESLHKFNAEEKHSCQQRTMHFASHPYKCNDNKGRSMRQQPRTHYDNLITNVLGICGVWMVSLHDFPSLFCVCVAFQHWPAYQVKMAAESHEVNLHCLPYTCLFINIISGKQQWLADDIGVADVNSNHITFFNACLFPTPQCSCRRLRSTQWKERGLPKIADIW